MRQSVLLRIIEESAVFPVETGQALVRCEPQTPPFIFQYAINKVVRQTVFHCILLPYGRCALFIAVQPCGRAYPDVVTAVFQHTEGLYQSMQIGGRGKMQFFQFPTGIQKQAFFRSYPDSAFRVAEQSIYQYILQFVMLLGQRMRREFSCLFIKEEKPVHPSYPKRSGRFCSVQLCSIQICSVQ